MQVLTQWVLKPLLYIGLCVVPVLLFCALALLSLPHSKFLSVVVTPLCRATKVAPITSPQSATNTSSNFAKLDSCKSTVQDFQKWASRNWLELGVIFILTLFIIFIFFQARKSLKYMDHACSEMNELCQYLKSKEFTTKAGLKVLTDRFFEDKFSKTSRLGRLWEEFCESFVIDNKGVIVGNSKRPQDFFNYTDVGLSYKIDSHAIEGFNGKSIGLGMLGTFMGLTFGISQLSLNIGSADEDQLMASITSLLAGAGLAFSSSLYGIFSSLFFASLRKEHTIKFDNSLHKLNNCLEEKLTLFTQEQELKDHNIILHQQLDVFKNMNANLDEKLKDQIRVLKDMDEHINTKLDEVPRKLAEPLKQAIETLSKVIDGSGKQIMDKTFEQSTTKIEKVVSNLLIAAEKTNATIERLSDSTDEMQQKFSQQQENANESMSSSLSNFQDSVSNSSTTLQDLLNDIKQNFRLQQEQLMQSNQENIQKNIQGMQSARGLLDESLKSFSQMVEAVARRRDQDQKTLQQILEAQNQSEKSIQQIVDASEKTAKNVEMINQMPNQIKKAFEGMDKINSATENIYQNHTKNFKSLQEGLKNGFDDALEQITQKYTKSFQDVDESLNKFTEELTQGLEGSIKKMHEQLNDIQGQLSPVVQNFKGVAEELHDVAKELHEAVEELEVQKPG